MMNKGHVCVLRWNLFQQLQVLYLAHTIINIHKGLKGNWRLTPASFVVDNLTIVALSCLSGWFCPLQRGSAATPSDWCTVEQEASSLISTLQPDFQCSSRNPGNLGNSMCVCILYESFCPPKQPIGHHMYISLHLLFFCLFFVFLP